MIGKIVRILSVLCLFVLTSFGAVTFAADVPAWNKADYYVQDYANVLSKEQKAELNRYGEQLNNATGAELAVLTLPTIGDEAIDSFAVKALREYKLGKSGENNGALLVVTTDQGKDGKGRREFFLTVGYGLEGALPDGKVGRIMDDVAIPYLQEEQPDLAIMEAYKSYYNEIAKEYGWDGEVAPVSTISSGAGDSGFGIPFPVIIFIAIYIIFRVLGNKGGRGGGGSGGSGGRRHGGTTFFPGSFGGGSSGGGFGGGGGGFSGGGGSGGGGGAGRGW